MLPLISGSSLGWGVLRQKPFLCMARSPISFFLGVTLPSSCLSTVHLCATHLACSRSCPGILAPASHKYTAPQLLIFCRFIYSSVLHYLALPAMCSRRCHCHRLSGLPAPKWLSLQPRSGLKNTKPSAFGSFRAPGPFPSGVVVSTIGEFHAGN
jgi:hypothetical protein